MTEEELAQTEAELAEIWAELECWLCPIGGGPPEKPEYVWHYDWARACPQPPKLLCVRHCAQMRREASQGWIFSPLRVESLSAYLGRVGAAIRAVALTQPPA